MRRRWLLAAVASLGGFALEMACGEPYEGEIPNTSAPTRDGATSEDASDGRSPEPEADAAPDAAADAAPDVDPCTDRDKDGFLSKECEGGTDCDDDDDRAFPDAGFLAEAPTPVTKSDWNCDGKFTREYAPNIKCSDYQSDTLGNGCKITGFKEDPGCGEVGTLVKCKSPGLLATCQEESVSAVVQRCK